MKLTVVACALLVCACGAADGLLCDTPGCTFSAREWALLSSLAGLSERPPPDPSNRWADDEAAAVLGQQLYFDPRASGVSTLVDVLGRSTFSGRAAKGQPTGLSCASCHDPRRGGSDFTSQPNTTSIGAGLYDVNGQQTVNAAWYRITYWNGRNDSLWAQIVAVSESAVSMASNRLELAWLLRDVYAANYTAVFGEALPLTGTSVELRPHVEAATGQCTLEAGACPASCRTATGVPASCWPRFPLQGKPGSTPGCQPTSTSEPFHDAFDCMDPGDQRAITRVLVNFAKAIAAYEGRLVSRDSLFDRFIAAGPASQLLSASQRRGARLFVGKASCIECHSTPLFSDSEFHNVGVPQRGAGVPTEGDCPPGGRCDCVAGKNCLPWGALDGLAKLRANAFRRDSEWSDDRSDTTRADYLTRELGPRLKGAWRTPSLRDVELTAPYMHDGAYGTLEDVVAAYNRGGATAGFSGERSVKLAPLDLSDEEQADLIAFLRALTGGELPVALTSKPELPP